VHAILKIFDYCCVILVLPKPDSETISGAVYLGQLPANQRVFVCAYIPVTATEMFNLQIYWLNQAIVTLTINLPSPSHLASLSLSHSLSTTIVNKNKIEIVSICYN
jgi:hypothetical protein